MAETRYTLNNSASNGTSNLNYLLSVGHEETMKSLTPALLERQFGPGDEACYEPSRGYEDPEWYWEASNGFTWGIGWRWGSPRLRGRGNKQKNQNSQFWDHPEKEDAAEFIEFLVEQLKG